MLFSTQQHGENNLFDVFPVDLTITEGPRQAGSAPGGKPFGAFFCELGTDHPIERGLCGLCAQRCAATFEFVFAMGW